MARGDICNVLSCEEMFLEAINTIKLGVSSPSASSVCLLTTATLCK